MKNVDKPRVPVINIYGIFDVLAGRYFPPFVSDNDQTARRMFSQMVRNPESDLARNPQDYRLFLLGDFDPIDGQIDPLLQPMHVADAQQFLIVDKDTPQVNS